LKDILPVQIPPILDKKCNLLAIIITLILLTSPVLLAFGFWYVYEQILISLFLFIFLQFVSGVITSKMRISSIPFDQIDIDFTTYEIAKWYIDKYFCPKEITPSDRKELMST